MFRTAQNNMEISLGCPFPPNAWEGKGHHARFRGDLGGDGGSEGWDTKPSGTTDESKPHAIPFSGCQHVGRLTHHKKKKNCTSRIKKQKTTSWGKY